MPFLNEGSSLKEKIEEAKGRLLNGIDRLEKLEMDLDRKIDGLWNEIVKSLESEDSMRAGLLTRELFEMRKLKKIVQSKKQDLEMACAGLSLASELGEVAKTLASLNETLKGLDQAMPASVEGIYGAIGTAIMAGEIPIFCSEEAERILSEAAAIARSRKEPLR